MSRFGRRLARTTGLDASLTEMVIETAVEIIKTRRPDLAPDVDRLLASPRGVARAAAWIARWGRHLDPR